MAMLCSQCGGPAERCERCKSALCGRRLCAELHEASCAAVSAMPVAARASGVSVRASRPTRRRERDVVAERILAEQLALTIGQHRRIGRAALLAGDLDTAFHELNAARQLEPDLDRLGASARALLPADWELETDLTPLARALSARLHPRAGDAWRHVLDDRPARSVQAEAAEWLACEALAAGSLRPGLRMLHAASSLGRPSPTEAFRELYTKSGLDPHTAFGLYLTASRLDAGAARAVVLRDPLTSVPWVDQDARWWVASSLSGPDSDHQQEALGRARDLACTPRDEGWLLLAEGDYASGPLGARSLGRAVRAGRADPADEDAFVRIRLAYEAAADRLTDVAWPWYRLAELMAWAGFAERALEHLARADGLSLGTREADRAHRPLLRALVQAGLGNGPTGLPTVARPFPAEPFGAPRRVWRLGFR